MSAVKVPDAVLEALRTPGGVVAYPTETVYGIGGRAADAAAARRVAEIKGRGMQPLIVLVNAPPPGLPPLADALAARFWPGPLTLVVPAEGLGLDLAPEVLAPGGTVGLRHSGHPAVTALIEAVGPITSSSANHHGQAPPRRADEVDLPVDALFDWGTLPDAAPSTVVDVGSGAVLRAGALAEAVRRALAEPPGRA